MTGAGLIRILLVDDNPDDRVLVRREAEALYPDAQLREVGSREEFEAATKSGCYDLVVTDLQLKWGTGREVLAAVRETSPESAVVMFTGTGDEMTAVELMKAGLDDYVVKTARQLPRLRVSMKLAMESARNRSALSERERQLTAALAHKDLLVRELHHRVKNNLQTIVALLELKARELDKQTAITLNDLAGRMRALGKVQSRIYETRALDRIEFTGTLREIADELVKVYGRERIRLITKFDVSLDIEVSQAMPLALLCYEVMLNAMKHAWPDGRSGTISLELQRNAAGSELRLSDDGIGFIKKAAAKGFGSQLTPALAREAGVEVVVETIPGTGTTVLVRLK